VRGQATLFRIISIVEAYAVQELVVRFEPHAPSPRSGILDDVYVAAEDRAIGSWPGLRDHYRRWFDIRFTTFPSARRVQAMIDARHAIAHGVGELTRRQARKNQDQLVRELRTIGVGVVGQRIQVSKDSVSRCVQVAITFVLWLDEALSAYDLGAPSGPA
jgi:hypothetical protein